MNNVLFYIMTILIWGSSWYVIKLQLGDVHSILSVAYRFALAGAVLFAFMSFISLRKHKSPQHVLSIKDHGAMALQGILLFSLNYSIFYLATDYLTSGLVAVVFSTISIHNIFNQALFFKKSVNLRVFMASLIGLTGIIFVFLPEITVLSLESDVVYGLILSLVGTYIASLGNMMSLRNSQAGISVNTANKWGMTYGAVGSFILVLFMGVEINFSFNFDYLWSLFYLAIVASVIAFGCYLTLVKNIGADRAAYVAVLFPLVALTISTIFENYIWHLEAAFGILLILLGNVLILTKPGQVKQIIRSIFRTRTA